MKIQNANTHSFDTITEQVLAESIPLQRPAMPRIALYTTPVRLPGPVVGGKVGVPIVTNIQNVQTNPTSYENHNDSVDHGEVTLVHYSAQFGFNNPEQANGLELKMLLASHLTEIEKNIQTAINAQISETNFASAVVTVASGSYAVANLETLLAAVPARTVVCLDSAYYVKTKATWLPAGDEDKLRELSQISGMGTNIKGFAARPEAIATVYGYPSTGPTTGGVKSSFITLPIGLDVQFSRWYTLGGRSWSGSLDICLGAVVGQSGAMKLLKSS